MTNPMPKKGRTLLNVNPDFDSLDEESEFFADHRVQGARCLGPDTSAECPLLSGRSCPKAAGADLILFQLDLNNADHRKILRSYRDEHPATVVAAVSPEEALWWSDELEGVEVIVGPPGTTDLKKLAERCLGQN